MSTADTTAPLPYRVRELERRMLVVEDDVKPVPVMQSEIDSLQSSVRDLSEGVKSLRNAIVTFAFTVAGSAVAVLIGLVVTSRG